jgi:hypothetical protein
MDEYESMKIFNPYVQMALGMLAGNSGATKSQAFANAMGGGLNAVQTAQTNQQRQSAASREAEMHKLKLDEYARMQASVKNARAFAAKMAEKGGPMADYWKGVSETDDPSAIMKMGALQAEFEQQANRNRYNDIMEKQYMNPTQKQQSYTLPSKQDVLSGHSMLMEDPEFGEKYKVLSTDQQKAIASKYATAAKALADKGDPDPWNSARAVIGTLPEANLNMLQKFGKGLKENAEGVVESFKEVLGW